MQVVCNMRFVAFVWSLNDDKCTFSTRNKACCLIVFSARVDITKNSRRRPDRSDNYSARCAPNKFGAPGFACTRHMLFYSYHVEPLMFLRIGSFNFVSGVAKQLYKGRAFHCNNLRETCVSFIFVIICSVLSAPYIY